MERLGAFTLACGGVIVLGYAVWSVIAWLAR
jgi:hypothetical protein